MRILDSISSIQGPADPVTGGVALTEPAPGFAVAMDQVKQEMSYGVTAQTKTVSPNDNLTQWVKQEASARGIQLDATQQRLAINTLARDNQLDNPDRIRVGQKLRVDGLYQQLDQLKDPARASANIDDARSRPLSNTGTDGQATPYAQAEVSTQDHLRTVKNRDTLSQIVTQEAKTRGLSLSQAQVYKEVMELAQSNRLSNPNQIRTGQQLNLAQLQSHLDNIQKTTDVDATAATSTRPQTMSANTSAQASARSGASTAYPVLNQTLDRAVARGFIPANERQDVYNKILQVAQKHQFSPDDFARLTLMESDGMNPRASNQRCHGIIQFCDGPTQGAAGVGYGQAPKSILNLSVYQQLHLVDVYFDKVGLKKQGPVKLDDLYLSVLHPAARSETRPEAPLGIAGTQAQALYEGRNTQAPITRNSIIQGLWKNAMDRLGWVDKPVPPQVGSIPVSSNSALSKDTLVASSSKK